MRLSLVQPNHSVYALYDGQTYADVRVDARVEFDASGQGTAGVICRYDPRAGWYEFNIHPDQTYTLLFGTWLAEGVARYVPLVIAESEKIDPSVNEMGLQCQGGILTPFINGTQLRKRDEKKYVLTQGQVGLSAASFEGVPLLISFDRVQVDAPE